MKIRSPQRIQKLRIVLPLVAAASLAPSGHRQALASGTEPAAVAGGIRYVYAFEFSVAEAHFRAAAAADPAAAMPYWGLALALGPNYNQPRPSLQNEIDASSALANARKRARTPEERDLIAALSLRFSCDPRPDYPGLETAYANAMQAVTKKYPDDPDAAVLYAESRMEQRAWRLWNADGSPAPGTDEIVAVLQAVLARWPNHVGANHLYIHAVEASPHPELALTSARRLETLMPDAGHLLHMPAHIYMRTGDYAGAVRDLEAAARADRKESDPGYVNGYGRHNLSFLAAAATMEGDYPTAIQAARAAARGATGTAQAYALAPWMIMARSGRWDEILSAAPPPANEPKATAVWHFARAAAFAARGDVKSAVLETSRLRAMAPQLMPLGAVGVPPISWPLFQQLITLNCDARIATARGNHTAAANFWRQEVAAADRLGYSEPPAWYPVRVPLGAALLRAGEAAEAEKTFRESLARNPGDPRAWFGLAAALRLESRPAEAANANAEYVRAWKGTPLRLQDL